MFCFSFSKTQLAMQLPAEKQEKRGLPHRLTVAFHNGLHRGADGRTDVRTYVRQTDSDVITKPKFLAFTGYQILLAMGLRSRAPCGARGSSANKGSSAVLAELLGGGGGGCMSLVHPEN